VFGKFNRRKFLKMSGTAAASFGAFGSLCDALKTGPLELDISGWKPGDPIGYVNASKIPAFHLPPYEGERYEASVPDTFDIAERANLAVNVLTEATNPLADYEAYDLFSPFTNPPSMTINQWYFPYEEGHVEALIRNRIISGSQQNLQVERRWMEVTLKLQGPDGLLYVPVKGRPWALDGFQIRDIEVPKGDQILEPYVCGSMLRSISVYARRNPDGPWRSVLRRLVDGMINLAVSDGDYAYYWPSCMYATTKRPPDVQMPARPFEIEGTQVPLGLVDAYHELEYESALVLAGKNINYLRKNFYDEGGRFLASPGLKLQAHGGAHLRGLLAMEQYAEVARDREMMDFVVRGFEHALDLGANSVAGTSDYDIKKAPGAELLGYFPEWTDSPAWQSCETDQVADMIYIALRLSEAGIADYWDDADRRIRNQFAENQLLETGWMYYVSKNGLPAKQAINVTTDRVSERIKGGFAGNASVNDWAGRNAHSGMGACCTAYGTNCLYWVWEHILRYRNGKLKVNLLMNRVSEWADIDSCIPYLGRVDVTVKKAVDLSVRIPEWVKPEQTQCQVNGQERTLGWDGRYAKVGSVKPGDVAKLSFPIFERTDKVWIEKKQYTLIRKGNEVVSIDPPGVYHPLYQRAHYRQNDPRMRKVTRFVSHENV
jgi:hypothetical protein